MYSFSLKQTNHSTKENAYLSATFYVPKHVVWMTSHKLKKKSVLLVLWAVVTHHPICVRLHTPTRTHIHTTHDNAWRKLLNVTTWRQSPGIPFTAYHIKRSLSRIFKCKERSKWSILHQHLVLLCFHHLFLYFQVLECCESNLEPPAC